MYVWYSCTLYVAVQQSLDCSLDIASRSAQSEYIAVEINKSELVELTQLRLKSLLGGARIHWGREAAQATKTAQAAKTAKTTKTSTTRATGTT